MDTYNIKLVGSAEIPHPLDENKNIVLAGEYEHISTNKRDQKDGSWRYTYQFKPLRIAKLEESGEKIRLKTKNSNSVRLRWAVMKQAESKGLDPEEYYNQFTDRIIANLEGVLIYLEQ